jgi:hypothetical protein
MSKLKINGKELGAIGLPEEVETNITTRRHHSKCSVVRHHQAW